MCRRFRHVNDGLLPAPEHGFVVKEKVGQLSDRQSGGISMNFTNSTITQVTNWLREHDAVQYRSFVRLTPAQQELARFGIERHLYHYAQLHADRAADFSAIREIIDDARHDLSYAMEMAEDSCRVPVKENAGLLALLNAQEPIVLPVIKKEKVKTIVVKAPKPRVIKKPKPIKGGFTTRLQKSSPQTMTLTGFSHLKNLA
jgi:hypothetical protein